MRAGKEGAILTGLCTTVRKARALYVPNAPILLIV